MVGLNVGNHMTVPPKTNCPKCGQQLLSAGYSDDNGEISLDIPGHLKMTKADNGDMWVMCPTCKRQSPATTFNELRAMGWNGAP